ncbi:MAG: DUF3667 domain-containing protein [Terriglobia bacterium]
MNTIPPWTCPICNTVVLTPFCSGCGERPANPRDLTVQGLLDQFFQAISNIDGRFIRSFRCLVSRPGALTVAYLRGMRLPFIGPFQLFLLTNVLFFAMQSITKMNVVSSTLESHLHNQDWSSTAQRLVSRRLEAKQTSLDHYAPTFNQANLLHAKTFIILMVLPFALFIPVLFFKKRQPFVAHVVFSLHFYAFLLLLFCASLAVAGVSVLFGGEGLNSSGMDKVLSIFIMGSSAVYLYLAAGTVYGASGGIRLFKVILLALAAAVILLGYRFVLFLITLYWT